MKQKKIVSGPIHGPLKEIEVDRGKGKGVPRQGLIGGKTPRRLTGWSER